MIFHSKGGTKQRLIQCFFSVPLNIHLFFFSFNILFSLFRWRDGYHYFLVSWISKVTQVVYTRVRGSIKKYEDKVAVNHISFIKVITNTWIDMFSFSPFDVNVLLLPEFNNTMFCHHITRLHSNDDIRIHS